MNISSFIKAPRWKKALSMRIFCYLSVVKLVVLFLPFRWLSRRLGYVHVETLRGELDCTDVYIKSIISLIPRISNKLPWRSACLHEAIVAWLLLRRLNLPMTLYIGTRHHENKMIVHAWLRCGQYFISGGDGSGYAVIISYSYW